jgi:hypothetical protein
MARTFKIKVEGLSPDVNSQMVKDAIDNALEKVRKNFLTKCVMNKKLYDVLSNLNITSICEREKDDCNV